MLNTIFNKFENSNFSYQHILDKMREENVASRYSTFSEIKKEITTNEMNLLEVNQSEKETYQKFCNSIYETTSIYTDKKEFVDTINDFINNIKILLEKNCFEDFIKPNLLISTIVKSSYRYNNNRYIDIDIVKTFYKWFSKLNEKNKNLVFDNLIYKMNLIDEEIEYELPF